MKICTKCKVGKSTDEYYQHKRSKDGLQSQCKQCAKDTATQWAKDNPERNRAKHRAASKRWVRANPEKRRCIQLRAKYGISLEEYNDILTAQGHVCAICSRSDTGDKWTRNLAVDHDHTTGKVRGLLCSPCNRALGLFTDDIDALQRAIDYLRRNK